MMTSLAIITFIAAVMFYISGSSNINPLWGLPFIVSCYLADMGAAAGMKGIESVEDKIIAARIKRSNKKN